MNNQKIPSRSIKKMLVDHSGNTYSIKDLEEDFHTKDGIISKKDLQSKKTSVTSTKGKTFLLIQPTFPDVWGSLQRGPQVMIQKDIGMILAKTGINHQSKVVDAGGGSGSLCLSLANVVKEVTTYEHNPEHHGLIQKNARLFGILNLTVKQENVYQGITEEDLDLITFDLPEPWQALPHAEKALKTGGHLVVYLPNLTQVKTFIDAAKESSIKVTETIELLERKWKIEDKIMRPEFEMLGHTGFMIFCRKF